MLRTRHFCNTLIVFLCLGVFASSCSKPEPSITRRSQFLMGTLVEISVFHPDQEAAQDAIQNAFNEIQRLENLLSTHKPDSEIVRINQSSGLQPIAVSPEVFAVIQRAIFWAEKTQGALDISLEPVQELWNFEADRPSLPDTLSLQQKLTKVDYSKIQLKNRTVFLPEKGMELNLGAIAKGYAVDRAMTVLQQINIHHALINAGGDLKSIGKRPDQTAWKIGLQHPRKPESILASFSLSGKAVATSGDYQKYFNHDGTRYHHILNPKTGYPATVSMSATVITENVMDADALSTALFVMGPKKGLALIDSLENTEALFVDPNLLTYSSQGMQALQGFTLNRLKEDLSH